SPDACRPLSGRSTGYSPRILDPQKSLGLSSALPCECPRSNTSSSAERGAPAIGSHEQTLASRPRRPLRTHLARTEPQYRRSRCFPEGGLRDVRCLAACLFVAILSVGPLTGTALAQPREVFIPLLVYRTGPYASSGTPTANGLADYYTLINERDGGVNGIKLAWEECEFQYDTKQGVECYERLKGKGAVLVFPISTAVMYELIPRAPTDKIPVIQVGAGMTAAADGRWFPWVFNFPGTYWSQASAVIQYIGRKEGGLDKLKGRKIAHIFLSNPYGKEANPILDALARRHGFQLTLLAVNPPGQEQKAIWLQVRRLDPNWIFMSGWGVMNQVAIKEAAAIGYPMDH